MKQTVYDKVAERVLEYIATEKTLPWNQSWITKQQINYKSKRPYNGVNRLLTAMQMRKSNLWLTYKQAKELGGYVRKGEKATPIIFWKPITKEVENENGELEEKTFGFHRMYYVFNSEQIEGIEFEGIVEEDTKTFDINKEVEKIVDGIEATDLRIVEASDPYYHYGDDVVGVPNVGAFDSIENYYSTLLHELAHATGHKSRLNRKIKNRFGSEKYGREELTAEMASAYVMASLGINTENTERNTAGYIKSWANAISKDPRIIISASNDASRASDWLLEVGGELEAEEGLE